MKPYYQDNAVTIYHGDCRDVLASYRGMIGVIFADPPFNVGKQYGNSVNDRREDYRSWCGEWIELCFSSLRQDGSFYLMTLSRHLEWKMPIMCALGVFVSLITWKNVSASHDKRRYWNAYQPIMCYAKSSEYIFNTYSETRSIDPCWQRARRERQKGQLLDYWDDIPMVYAGSIVHREAVLEPGTARKAHPCQMPQALAARAINFSSIPEHLILDPFMGSGTTLRAAKDLGRKAIGIEIEERYCEIAAKRMAQDVFDLASPQIPEHKMTDTAEMLI